MLRAIHNLLEARSQSPRVAYETIAMRRAPTAASGAWRPESLRSLPETRDRIASGFDRRGAQDPLHAAPGRATQELPGIAAALRPHMENIIARGHAPDRPSQNSGFSPPQPDRRSAARRPRYARSARR